MLAVFLRPRPALPVPPDCSLQAARTCRTCTCAPPSATSAMLVHCSGCILCLDLTGRRLFSNWCALKTEVNFSALGPGLEHGGRQRFSLSQPARACRAFERRTHLAVHIRRADVFAVPVYQVESSSCQDQLKFVLMCLRDDTSHCSRTDSH